MQFRTARSLAPPLGGRLGRANHLGRRTSEAVPLVRTGHLTEKQRTLVHPPGRKISPVGSGNSMRRLWRLILPALLVACIALVLPYGPALELATLASGEFLGSIFASDDSSSDIQARTKDIPVKNLTEMLTYANPEARSFAAKALAYRSEAGAVPELIQALNDTRPFRDRRTKDETSLAEISKEALTGILKAQITKEPENIALLAKFFTAAERGALPERKSVIEILGEIREPLARQPMLDIVAERNRELSEPARRSLAKIDSQAMENDEIGNLARRQVRMAVASALLMALLIGSVGYRLIKGLHRDLAFLSIVPIFLLGSFGAVILSDYSRGEVDKHSIDAAVQNQDLKTLRAINYHDSARYPGDSYVARYLLRRCDEEVIRCLMLLPSVQATDDETVTKLTDTRKRWVLARFIGSNLGSPRLDALLNSGDADVRVAVASTLGTLAVRNDYITAALTRLAGDANERVRSAAEKALARVGKYPIWASYSPEGREQDLTKGGRPPGR